MSVKELKCPKCGAGVTPDKNMCEYCNTYYMIDQGTIKTSESIIVTKEYMEEYLKWLYKNKRNICQTLTGERFNPEGFEQLMEYTNSCVRLAWLHLIDENKGYPTLAVVCERAELYLRREE